MAEALKVVNYQGVLGIEQSQEIKKELAQLIKSDCSVVINLSRVESLDLSIVQLLIAAKKSVLQRDLTVHIAGQVSPPVVEAFRLCGLVHGREASGKDIDRIIDEHLKGNL